MGDPRPARPCAGGRRAGKTCAGGPRRACGRRSRRRSSSPMDRLGRRRSAAGLWLPVLVAAALPARAQTPTEAPFRPEYEIRVRVDPEQQSLHGEERLRWTNQSKDEVFDLWFHLYWNAFANNRSTHLVESKGELRGSKIADEWGWQQITGLRIDSGDSLSKLEWMAPDD